MTNGGKCLSRKTKMEDINHIQHQWMTEKIFGGKLAQLSIRSFLLWYAYEGFWMFIGLILWGMTRFARSANNLHFLWLSSPAASLFGHVSRIEMTADASWVIFKQLPENWRRPPRRRRSIWICNISDDLSSFNMELTDARVAAQNRPFWRMLAKHGTTHALEAHIDWCDKISTVSPNKADISSLVNVTQQLTLPALQS